MNPLVSIIIPVYNGANYLREAIDSALAQTYENCEVIVVNDGSNDGKTESICLSYGDRIRYFSKPNGGVASALNLGIKNMRGDWFAWLSHDDLFSTDRISADITLLTTYTDACISYCKCITIDEKGSIIEEIIPSINRVTNLRDVMMLAGINMCSMTISRKCFDKAGRFDESNLTMQDVQMSLQLARYFHFVHNVNGAIYVREHGKRGTYTMSQRHRIDSRNLAYYLYNNTCFEEYFPKIDKTSIASFSCWLWLAAFFSFLGTTTPVNKCYYAAIHTRHTFCGRICQFARVVRARGRSILREQHAGFLLWFASMFYSTLFSSKDSDKFKPTSSFSGVDLHSTKIQMQI